MLPGFTEPVPVPANGSTKEAGWATGVAADAGVRGTSPAATVAAARHHRMRVLRVTLRRPPSAANPTHPSAGPAGHDRRRGPPTAPARTSPRLRPLAHARLPRAVRGPSTRWSAAGAGRRRRG